MNNLLKDIRYSMQIANITYKEINAACGYSLYSDYVRHVISGSKAVSLEKQTEIKNTVNSLIRQKIKDLQGLL